MYLFTDEWGYYFVQQMIAFGTNTEFNTNGNRGWELVQMIELDIWLNNPTPRTERVKRYIELMQNSEDEYDCYVEWRSEVMNNGLNYRVAEDNRRVSRGG